MAINLYAGLPGAGKSYEVVSEVILPALSTGRRVVTNIENLKIEEIRTYIEKKFGVPESQQGEIVNVKDADVKRARFWCGDSDRDDDGNVTKQGDETSIIKYGDLVILDEAWEYFGPTQTISLEANRFITKHRHYVDPNTKVSCDMVLVTQDPTTQINRQIKNLIDSTYVMRKHTRLGLSKWYRVDIYKGTAGVRSNPTKADTSYQRSYAKEVYALYDSYVGGKGEEKTIDKRSNILAKKSLWWMGGTMLIVVGFCLYHAVTYFYSMGHPKVDKSSNSSKTTLHNQLPSSGLNISNIQGQKSLSKKPNFSKEYRLKGYLELTSRRYAIVEDSDGNERAISPQGCMDRGVIMVCDLDGEKVTSFSGASNIDNLNGARNGANMSAPQIKTPALLPQASK